MKLVPQVHFGVNSGASRFAIERQAVNEANFRCPDELGWKPQVSYEEFHMDVFFLTKVAYHFVILLSLFECCTRRNSQSFLLMELFHEQERYMNASLS